MSILDTRETFPACPWLPAVARRLDAAVTRRHGTVKGAEFYLDALAYAQSQWLSGHPARAILQLNKAWMAVQVDPRAPEFLPAPYRALVWIVQRAAGGGCGFLGNPVRHFQHFASRMRGPQSELRVWRASACFHLASRTLEGHPFPQDGRQLARCGLWLPAWQRTLGELSIAGWPAEAEAARRAMADAAWR